MKKVKIKRSLQLQGTRCRQLSLSAICRAQTLNVRARNAYRAIMSVSNESRLRSL